MGEHVYIYVPNPLYYKLRKYSLHLSLKTHHFNTPNKLSSKKMTRATSMIITLLLLLLSMTHLGSSRIISLTSDGAAKSFSTNRSTILKLNLATTTTVTCEPIYGFLPCTTELWGQLFLIVMYEYLLSLGNQYVANGSELFFNMIGPGIFGASLFNILGTIPMVVLMLGTYAPFWPLAFLFNLHSLGTLPSF